MCVGGPSLNQQILAERPLKCLVCLLFKNYLIPCNCQPQAKAKAQAMPGRLYIHTKMRIACAGKRIACAAKRIACAANKLLLCPI